MKARELKELKADELDQRIRALRREIARMLTVKREAQS